MSHVDVSHQAITVSTADEADSLAGYLNEHGIFAITDGAEVRAASPDVDTDTNIRTLKSTWRMFWDNSDSGLFGLPMFIKEA